QYGCQLSIYREVSLSLNAGARSAPLWLCVAISTYKKSMCRVARRGFYRTRAVKTIVMSAKK
ncbi:MAG: hypothetical protein J6S23_02655, partial [Clostridia bacterium]|nr:hypothetical protein [Clostridia bacterium]